MTNLSTLDDAYLEKTYCHLVNNVKPQNEQNKREYPPADNWVGISGEIDKAISAITNELNKRGLTPHCQMFK